MPATFLRIAHSGRADIKFHWKSAKHKAVTPTASTSSIKTFLKNGNPVKHDLVIAAKDASFVSHTAMYDMSFKTSDRSPKRFQKFFNQNSAKTKCEVVSLNVLVPFSVEELSSDLQKSLFVSFTHDISNRERVVPIVVR